jgi:hypothetical protein
MSEPLGPVSDGRDSRGRFGPGNKAAKGNPYAKRVAQLRAALLKSVSRDDVREIIRALVEKARGGDVAAAREVLDRCLGRPLPADVEERLAALEATGRN